MNILITAGGTTEKIDEVRGITNTGTGRLGARIAEAFGAEPGVRHIFYLCSAKAVRPVCEKVSILVADDTEALAQAVKTLCGQERIDVVIHSMAVSDYRTGAVTSAAALTEQILAALAKTGDTASDRQRIQEALDKAPALSAEGKIGSGHEDLIVMLKPTPKIIGLFRGLCPDAILVGFKLLSGVPEPVLIETAYGLLQKNDCDFVLANDLARVGDVRHTGHLVDQAKHYETWHTKEEIAAGIVQAVGSRWNHKQESGKL